MGPSGLPKFTVPGVNMTKYQFRTNWRNQLILQRLHTTRDRWGDRCGEWRDATATDLKYYYAELYQPQDTVREQFEKESGWWSLQTSLNLVS